MDELASGADGVTVLPTWPDVIIAAAGGRLYVTANGRVLAYDPATGARQLGTLPGAAAGFFAAAATANRLYLSTVNHLLVVDTTGPSGPLVVGQTDGEYDEMVIDGSWMFTLQLADPAGLTVLSLADPDHPVPVAVQPADDQWHYVAAGEGRLLLLPSDCHDTAVLVFDTSAMPALRLAAQMDSLEMPVYNVIALDDVAYVELNDGWQIFDFARPESPVDGGPVRPWLTTSDAIGPSLQQGDRLFQGRRGEAVGNRVDVLDVHAPLSPTLLASVPVPDDAGVTALAADDRHVYIATAHGDSRARLEVMDLADARNAQHLGGMNLGAPAFAMAAEAGFVYAGVDQAVVVVDASEGLVPRRVAQLDLGGDVIDLQRAGRQSLAGLNALSP